MKLKETEPTAAAATSHQHLSGTSIGLRSCSTDSESESDEENRSGTHRQCGMEDVDSSGVLVEGEGGGEGGMEERGEGRVQKGGGEGSSDGDMGGGMGAGDGGMGGSDGGMGANNGGMGGSDVGGNDGSTGANSGGMGAGNGGMGGSYGDVDSVKTKPPDSSDDSDVDISTTESVRYEYFLQLSQKTSSPSFLLQTKTEGSPWGCGFTNSRDHIP